MEKRKSSRKRSIFAIGVVYHLFISNLAFANTCESLLSILDSPTFSTKVKKTKALIQEADGTKTFLEEFEGESVKRVLTFATDHPLRDPIGSLEQQNIPVRFSKNSHELGSLQKTEQGYVLRLNEQCLDPVFALKNCLSVLNHEIGHLDDFIANSSGIPLGTARSSIISNPLAFEIADYYRDGWHWGEVSKFYGDFEFHFTHLLRARLSGLLELEEHHFSKAKVLAESEVSEIHARAGNRLVEPAREVLNRPPVGIETPERFYENGNYWRYVKESNDGVIQIQFINSKGIPLRIAIPSPPGLTNSQLRAHAMLALDQISEERNLVREMNGHLKNTFEAIGAPGSTSSPGLLENLVTQRPFLMPKIITEEERSFDLLYGRESKLPYIDRVFWNDRGNLANKIKNGTFDYTDFMGRESNAEFAQILYEDRARIFLGVPSFAELSPFEKIQSRHVALEMVLRLNPALANSETHHLILTNLITDAMKQGNKIYEKTFNHDRFLAVRDSLDSHLKALATSGQFQKEFPESKWQPKQSGIRSQAVVSFTSGRFQLPLPIDDISEIFSRKYSSILGDSLAGAEFKKMSLSEKVAFLTTFKVHGFDLSILEFLERQGFDQQLANSIAEKFSKIILDASIRTQMPNSPISAAQRISIFLDSRNYFSIPKNDNTARLKKLESIIRETGYNLKFGDRSTSISDHARDLFKCLP